MCTDMLSSSYMDGAPQYRDYDLLPLISALNLVLQQHPTRTGVRVGKNHFIFPSSAEKFDIGPGIQAVQGFYASVRPAHQQLNAYVMFLTQFNNDILTIFIRNVCMSAFIEPGRLTERLKSLIKFYGELCLHFPRP